MMKISRARRWAIAFTAAGSVVLAVSGCGSNGASTSDGRPRDAALADVFVFMDTEELPDIPDAPGPSVWTQQLPATLPTAAQDVGLTDDPTRLTVIRYGGTGSDSNASDETWTWDGTDWTLRSTTGTPGARLSPSLVSGGGTDASAAFLFGGDSTNDIWQLDGTDWSMATSGGPSARSDAAMTLYYPGDPSVSGVILFGGAASTDGSSLGDTWIFKNGEWISATTTSSPSARYGASFCNDYNHSELVLFGGTDGTTVNNETWNWFDNDWIQVHPTNSPPARSGAAISYVAALHVVLLFGGTDANGNLLNDTWAWDRQTSNWTELTQTVRPSARTGARMIYEVDVGATLLFGGRGADGYLNDTWIFGPR